MLGRRKKEEGSSATDSLSEDVTDVTDVSPREVGRKKKEEGRRKKKEGRREDTRYKLMVFVPVLYLLFCDFSGFFSFPLSSSPLIITHCCFPIRSFSSTSIR